MTSPSNPGVSELLPCPFCGGPVYVEETRPASNGQRFWGVTCRNTLNVGGTCAIEQIPSGSRETAIARWNARALAHIDTLEQTAAERVIADGSRGPTPDYTGEGSAWVPPKCQPIPTSGQREKDVWNDGFAYGWEAGFNDDERKPVERQAVVVPEPTSDEWRMIAENARSADMVDFLAGAAAYGLWLRGKIPNSIPAGRVLGEGMVGMDGKMIESAALFLEEYASRIPGISAVIAALRANQGGK